MSFNFSTTSSIIHAEVQTLKGTSNNALTSPNLAASIIWPLNYRIRPLLTG